MFPGISKLDLATFLIVNLKVFLKRTEPEMHLLKVGFELIEKKQLLKGHIINVTQCSEV
jgi:hypothetical protein